MVKYPTIFHGVQVNFEISIIYTLVSILKNCFAQCVILFRNVLYQHVHSLWIIITSIPFSIMSYIWFLLRLLTLSSNINLGTAFDWTYETCRLDAPCLGGAPAPVLKPLLNAGGFPSIVLPLLLLKDDGEVVEDKSS